VATGGQNIVVNNSLNLSPTAGKFERFPEMVKTGHLDLPRIFSFS
jgi:hypothetical protein